MAFARTKMHAGAEMKLLLELSLQQRGYLTRLHWKEGIVLFFPQGGA